MQKVMLARNAQDCVAGHVDVFRTQEFSELEIPVRVCVFTKSLRRIHEMGPTRASGRVYAAALVPHGTLERAEPGRASRPDVESGEA